jgi:hypothetical protein
MGAQTEHDRWDPGNLHSKVLMTLVKQWLGLLFGTIISLFGQLSNSANTMTVNRREVLTT